MRTSVACIESVAFLLAQLTLEGQRSAESDVRLKEEMAKQRHENGRLTMQVFLDIYSRGREYSINIQSRSDYPTGAINPISNVADTRAGIEARAIMHVENAETACVGGSL